jgi:hypothetical protein
MALNLFKRLFDFTQKTTPIGADIVYMGDSVNNFSEVKVLLSAVYNGFSPTNGFSMSGGTGSNVITIPTNLADAYDLTDSATINYYKISSTIGRPRSIFNQEVYINSPLTIGGYLLNIPGSIYNTNLLRTASQSGTTVTGVGTAFTSSMIGGGIYWPATQNYFVITNVSSSTVLTVDQSATISSSGFFIYYGGIILDYAGLRLFQDQPILANIIDTPASGIGTVLSLCPTNGTTVNYNKGQIHSVTSVITSTYTTLNTDYTLACNSSGTIAIALLASPETGRAYRIKDISGAAGTNNITITPNSGNIDGQSNYVINNNYGSVDVQYTGSQWSIL